MRLIWPEYALQTDELPLGIAILAETHTRTYDKDECRREVKPTKQI